jgi:deferrochelatase/peroxidase EfeB
MDVPEDEAEETLRAKITGRWSDGVPISKVPGYDEWRQFGKEKGFYDKDPFVAAQKQGEYLKSTHAADFRFADDMSGYKCPVGAHMRRMNTRDYLDPLNKVGTDPETGAQYANPDATTA